MAFLAAFVATRYRLSKSPLRRPDYQDPLPPSIRAVRLGPDVAICSEVRSPLLVQGSRFATRELAKCGTKLAAVGVGRLDSSALGAHALQKTLDKVSGYLIFMRHRLVFEGKESNSSCHFQMQFYRTQRT